MIFYFKRFLEATSDGFGRAASRGDFWLAAVGNEPRSLSYFKDDKAAVQQLTSQLLTNFLPHTKKLPQATNQVTWGSRWN
ncbi:hypothetical protein FC49_GL000711 [Limosilactobacillus oris DSM 4864]|uniref:Uncharacterized protein n=1 Tax=Limosilactobacillus oris DSM 4864 TaxID=1423779 RepID=A0A0R1WFF7_9LACO|nr:hypothetical protein FC49_GL000711 [Limosilactobacillus oris DSM 4864]